MKTGTLAGAMLGASVAAISVLSACSDALRAGSEGVSEPPQPFTDIDAAPDGSSEAGLCNAYECPAPYATCADKSGRCTTNLANDVDHCGSCDVKCPPEDGELKAFFVCATGRCQMLCRANAADCDKVVDNGCEAALDSDPKNCGMCGNACAPGELCWQGACGCPPGRTECDGKCVRLSDDPQNCGACGKACSDAPSSAITWPCGEGVVPDGAAVTCVASKCQPSCVGGSADCNSDFCRDGCEVSTNDDSKNCGKCGRKCKDEQICFAAECLCDPGTTFCSYGCFDLQNDARNCGACGNVCPGAQDKSGSPVCFRGRCSYACAVGYGDCDSRIENGCEIDLTVDARHCGSCDTQCDLAGGQPCAAGKCLTGPCEPGGVK